MAGEHGAGLMVAPALVPLCAETGAAVGSWTEPLSTAALAVAVHTGTMLVVSAAIATTVYDWVGVEFLRRGWFNLDRIWTAALVVTGLALLVPLLPL